LDIIQQPDGRDIAPDVGGGDSVLSAWRHKITFLLLACGALALAAPALAQGKLEAHYEVTLAGIPIGKGNWIVEIDQTHYNAATSGVTTGLMRVLTHGEGTSAVRGTLLAGRPLHSIYASTIVSRKKTDLVRVTIDKGNVKDFRADPPPDHPSQRVPITDAQRHGVLDPMTAMLMRTSSTGDMLTPESCRRNLPIFDGRLRYDLKLDFKRLDTVKAAKGYAGPVLVCSVDFSPLGGYIPSHAVIKYITHLHGIEVWLAPIAGTRVLVPFRLQGPTPLGEAVLEATQFVTTAMPTRASAEVSKAH
jgi:Protein of unknown function (DUF3108)